MSVRRLIDEANAFPCGPAGWTGGLNRVLQSKAIAIIDHMHPDSEHLPEPRHLPAPITAYYLRGDVIDYTTKSAHGIDRLHSGHLR